MYLLLPHKFNCALSVTLGLISSPLTLLSSGPPDQRTQIQRWQSCHGNGSSWWHPASPPQWWKWYSLAHSGQAVAGIPYIRSRRGGEMEKEKEREWVKVVTQLSLWANLSPPTERHLSISPPLLLSCPPLSSSQCLRSACRGVKGGTCEWVGWDGTLLWQWRILAGGSSGGCWRCSWWGEIARIQTRCWDWSQTVGKSLFSCRREMSGSWSDKQWKQWNKHWQKKKKKSTWN